MVLFVSVFSTSRIRQVLVTRWVVERSRDAFRQAQRPFFLITLGTSNFKYFRHFPLRLPLSKQDHNKHHYHLNKPHNKRTYILLKVLIH